MGSHISFWPLWLVNIPFFFILARSQDVLTVGFYQSKPAFFLAQFQLRSSRCRKRSSEELSHIAVYDMEKYCQYEVILGANKLQWKQKTPYWYWTSCWILKLFFSSIWKKHWFKSLIWFRLRWRKEIQRQSTREKNQLVTKQNRTRENMLEANKFY